MNKIKVILTIIAKSVKDTIKNIVQNIEAVTILTLAAFGLTFLLSQLPFVIAIPMVIENLFNAGMLLPVISSLLIIGLVTIMEKRIVVHASPKLI